MPTRHLCPHNLLEIREYDEQNHTELYETLRVYLYHHQNAVRTARDLYIHRSMLFYRLKNLMNVDLDNARERLYLEISSLLLDGETRAQGHTAEEKK